MRAKVIYAPFHSRAEAFSMPFRGACMEWVLKHVFIQSVGQSTFTDPDLCARHLADTGSPRCMNSSPVLKDLTALWCRWWFDDNQGLLSTKYVPDAMPGTLHITSRHTSSICKHMADYPRKEPWDCTLVISVFLTLLCPGLVMANACMCTWWMIEWPSISSWLSILSVSSLPSAYLTCLPSFHVRDSVWKRSWSGLNLIYESETAFLRLVVI